MKYDSTYEECIVTFIDILGFKDLLDSSSAKKIAEILKRFRGFSKPTLKDSKTSFSERRLYTAAGSEIISDAIVRFRTIGTECFTGAFGWELLILLNLQIACIKQNILIRGALTIGEMHVGRNLNGPIFGPALVEAYIFENTSAIHPRIIISKKALKKYRKDKRLWNENNLWEDEKELLSKITKKDKKGVWFIDYSVSE